MKEAIVAVLILIAFLCVVSSYFKERGKRNTEKQMKAYKQLKPQDKVIIIHDKQKRSGVVIHGSSRNGYMINLSDVIVHVNFSNFDSVE